MINTFRVCIDVVIEWLAPSYSGVIVKIWLTWYSHQSSVATETESTLLHTRILHQIPYRYTKCITQAHSIHTIHIEWTNIQFPTQNANSLTECGWCAGCCQFQKSCLVLKILSCVFLNPQTLCRANRAQTVCWVVWSTICSIQTSATLLFWSQLARESRGDNNISKNRNQSHLLW